jgi:hypothetical protein
MSAAWPNPRFTIQADTDCVLDNMTGLIWARNPNPGGAMTWADAIAYCKNLTYGGQSDWRLPTRDELNSLVDVRYSIPPLCNTAGTGQWTNNDPFTGVQSYYYWSGTSSAYFAGYAWRMYMFNGLVSGCNKSGRCHVWPVRDGR